MVNPKLNLEQFIASEKAYFEGLLLGICWEDNKWDVQQWLFHRGGDAVLLFRSISSTIKSVPDNTITLPPPGPLPSPFSDFVKALAVHLHRTKNIGFIAIRNYVSECRRLHLYMHARGESCPAALTRWHFESVMDFLRTTGYKNLYDSSANLKVISEVLDKKQLTPYPIGFTAINSTRNYFAYGRQADPINEDERPGEEKLPSYEAMKL